MSANPRHANGVKEERQMIMKKTGNKSKGGKRGSLPSPFLPWLRSVSFKKKH